MFIQKLLFLYSRKTNGRLRSFLAKVYLSIIKLRGFLVYGNKEMFHFVGIELSRECNRRCSYCPISKYPEFKKGEVMSFNNFAKIIDQLKAIHYSGYFEFAAYYEPLLRENFFKYLEYARKNLPRAKLNIFTNGDFLNKEVFERLRKNSVLLIITLHEDKSGERYRRLREITGGKNVIFKRNIEKGILFSRGGLVNVRNKIVQTSCIMSSVALTIDVEGKVILCCEDFFSKYTYGDTNQTNLLDIWQNKKFQEVKKALLKGKLATKICQSCFSRGTTYRS